jgi:acetyltransferase-like isoleucine patch superfamily enzyme
MMNGRGTRIYALSIVHCPFMKDWFSHGTGEIDLTKFRKLGRNVVFERGVLVFHPENIEIGDNVYVGHNAMLKGYYKNLMRIGTNTWIGQNCFFHSGGGITIGDLVGIGPGVQILTLAHKFDDDLETPIIQREQAYKPVVIENNCDIGVGSILLPGVTIGTGSMIGAGSVVTHDVEPSSVVAGNPAHLIRKRVGAT